MMTNTKAAAMVSTDAILEGRGDAAEAIALTVRATLDECVADLCSRLQAEHARVWPTLSRPTMRTARGRRFIKIIFGGSVWGWVEISNGLVWKTATRNAPALNYPRGCVFDVDSRRDMGASIYGVTKFGPYHAL